MRPNYVEIAKLYANAFAGSPWFEITRDTRGCGDFFGEGTKPGDICPRCRTTILEPAYPVEPTVAYIKGELGNPKSKLVVKESNNKLAGVGWGYSQEPDILIGKKYPDANRVDIGKQFAEYGVRLDDPWGYISEVFVDTNARMKGAGTGITRELLEYFLSLNLGTLFRTNQDSPMVRIAAKLGMENMPIKDPVRNDRTWFRSR